MPPYGGTQVTTPKQMGVVMKAAQAVAEKRVDGKLSEKVARASPDFMNPKIPPFVLKTQNATSSPGGPLLGCPDVVLGAANAY